MPLQPRRLRATLTRLGAFSLAGAALPLGAAVAQDLPSAVNSQHYQLQVEVIAEGIEHPWGLAFLPDGRYFVTERNSGQLRLGDAEGGLSDPIEGVPEIFRFEGITSRSQGGLLDVLVDPDFDENGYVYLSYSKPTDHGSAVAVARGRLSENDNGGASLEEVEDVFTMKEEDQESGGLHFGGSMAFHPDDGSIFLSIGDKRDMGRSQDLEDQAGSIIRFMAEGGEHADSPFMDDEDADPFIYSAGHRNAQGMAFHPETGELWVNEHGPLGGDEVNLIEAGSNYGWPFVTAGDDYSGARIGQSESMDGMVDPVHVFEEIVAPSGLAFYRGELFTDWDGDMLHGGLHNESIIRQTLENGEISETEIIDIGRRVRGVQVAEDGAIWVITEHEDGEVLRLTPGEN